MRKRGVVCAGIVTVDMVFALESPLDLNLKNRAAESHMTVGGCALNAARAVAGLGGRASLAGVVGDDLFGDWVRSELASSGVDTSCLHTRANHSTARSAVLVSEHGERTIVNHRSEALYGVGLDGIDLRGIGAVLADTRWPRGAADLIAAARKAGLPAVIDAEAPVSHAAEALRGASHVAFSEQGLADFAGGHDGAALARAAADLGGWVCVTRGPNPVLCHDGKTLTEVPAFAVSALDTLGAGDVWHGAFAFGLAEGLDETDAVLRANAVAALKTTRASGAALPTRQDVNTFMEENA